MTISQHKKLNIAIVCDPVTDTVAGSFISTMRFAELLSGMGHKVIFIAAKSPRNNEDNYVKGIKVYRFFSILLPRSEKQFYISFPIISQIKDILKKEEIDILHAMIPTPSAVVSMRAAKELGIKIVAHSHTQPENVLLNLPITFGKDRLNRLFYRFLNWVYGKADAIVYPTEFAENFFHKLNAKMNNVVISNGVDTQRFKPLDPGPFMQKNNLSDDKFYILFVGRLHPEKSVDTLIKSMPLILKEHPNAYLLIAGFGYMQEALEALAWKLGIENNITFFGKLSDEDLVYAYNTCQVFILPSLAELEGMVVLEAIACGKPLIIANSKTSASTSLVNGNGLLFRPGDHKDLAVQISKMIGEEGLRKQMSNKSMELAKECDIRHSAQKLENLYYSLLK